MKSELKLLLAAWAVQAIAWAWLLATLPVFGYQRWSHWDRDEQRCHIGSYLTYNQHWAQCLSVDPRARRWSLSPQLRDSRFHRSIAGRQTYWTIAGGSPNVAECRDAKTGWTVARRTLSLPREYNLVGNRFVVIIRDGLSWLDLDQPASNWKKIHTSLVPILDPANQPGLGLIQPWNSGYRQPPRPRSFNGLINIDEQTVLATRIVSNSIAEFVAVPF